MRAGPGQLVEQLLDGVGDAEPGSGATWSRSTRGTGLGAMARRNASRRSSAVTPASRSGARSRKRSSSPAVRGSDRPASSARRGEGHGGVLERLALEQAGQQQVALLPQGQLVVEVEVVVAGQQAPGLQLDEGGGDEQELGGHLEVERRSHALELAEVGVDDRRQARPRRGRPARAGSGAAAGRTGPRRRASAPRRASPPASYIHVIQPVSVAGTSVRMPSRRRPVAPPTIARHGPRLLRHPAHRATSTSATTWARSGTGSTTSTTPTPSTASSTCTPSPSPRTRPSCAARPSTLATLLLAVGLDPDVCTLFVQSHVPRAHRAGLAAWSARPRSASCGA